MDGFSRLNRCRVESWCDKAVTDWYTRNLTTSQVGNRLVEWGIWRLFMRDLKLFCMVLSFHDRFFRAKESWPAVAIPTVFVMLNRVGRMDPRKANQWVSKEKGVRVIHGFLEKARSLGLTLDFLVWFCLAGSEVGEKGERVTLFCCLDLYLSDFFGDDRLKFKMPGLPVSRRVRDTKFDACKCPAVKFLIRFGNVRVLFGSLIRAGVQAKRRQRAKTRLLLSRTAVWKADDGFGAMGTINTPGRRRAEGIVSFEG